MKRQTRQTPLVLACLGAACGSVLLAVLALRSSAQQTIGKATGSTPSLPAGSPNAWVEDAVKNEEKIIESEGSLPVRFRERKLDTKGDTTREVVETKDGTVARLVERDGRPITAAEDIAERERLQTAVDAPSDFLKHHQKDKAAREDAIQVVRLLPQAMIYSYAAGQPQPKEGGATQVVVDFHPNPKFHPSTLRAEILTGIEGRVWIDSQSHRMTRIEGHVLRPLDLGYGLLARIFPGGELELEQINLGGDIWVYRHLSQHMTVRVMMVKTIPQRTEMTSWDFRPMPAVVSYQEAVKLLLSMSIPLQ